MLVIALAFEIIRVEDATIAVKIVLSWNSCVLMSGNWNINNKNKIKYTYFAPALISYKTSAQRFSWNLFLIFFVFFYFCTLN